MILDGQRLEMAEGPEGAKLEAGTVGKQGRCAGRTDDDIPN